MRLNRFTMVLFFTMSLTVYADLPRFDATANVTSVTYCKIDRELNADLAITVVIRNASSKPVLVDSIAQIPRYTIASSIDANNRGKFEFARRLDAIFGPDKYLYTHKKDTDNLLSGGTITLRDVISIPLGSWHAKAKSKEHFLSVTVPVLVKLDTGEYRNVVLRSRPAGFLLEVPAVVTNECK